MASLKAGVSRVNITPPVGIYLVGMERSENSHGLHDDLFATVVCLNDETNEMVILSADILLFNADMVARIRSAVTEQTGIPGSHVLFCATHCHSGPAPVSDSDRPDMEQAYAKNLPNLLIGAVRMAHDNQAPATIGYGAGNVRIGMNRRYTRPDGITVIDANPDRPVDEQVAVIRIDTQEGRPMAVLVNYACHSVVLGNGSNVISRDWPGVMEDLVEKCTGTKCMFIQGAAGDINPWPGVPTDRLDIMEKLGTEIGAEVVKVWAGIRLDADASLKVIDQKIALPLESVSKYAGKLPPLVEWDGAAGKMTYEQFQAWLYSMGTRPQKTIGDADNPAVMAEIQTIQIGDIAIFAFSAELFVKTGLTIKSCSPFAKTIVAAYSNGAVGYVPLSEDYPFGGYEVSEAFYGYGLPSPIAPEAEKLIEDKALEIIQALKK
jgi:neutral ceramidase